jgi:hypothetical protein
MAGLAIVLATLSSLEARGPKLREPGFQQGRILEQPTFS